MTYENPMKIAGFAVLMALSATAANAASDPGTAYMKDVKTCVEGVARFADYGDAGRVRHDIELVDRPLRGYSLSILTTVYGADDTGVMRRYQSECLSSGSAKPPKLRVDEATLISTQ